MNKITLFTFLIISFFLQNQITRAQCHIDDWTALKAIYETTGGNNWTNRAGWDEYIVNKNNPPANCNLINLYGVNSLDQDERVDYLTLSNNNLIGYIPNEIDKLGHLKKLYFINNQLSGNIPQQIGNLTMLTELKLYGNELTGSIPTEIGDLIDLSILWLFENQLEGTIPIELSYLTNLTELKINENNFTGTIPAQLGNLISLTELLLSGNLLTGHIPSSLSNLSNLTRLTVADNDLSGCYHGSLATFCTQLTHPLFNESTSISLGNNFDATWEDFCASNEGFCMSVPTNYSGLVELSATLTANNQYILQNNYTQIIDHITCNSNNNTNCNPINGFDNYTANEVFWASEKAYTYFLEKHNFNLTPVTSYINSSYIEFPNHAIYNSLGNAIYYGAGDGIIRTSMTSPDIVGHEITHHLINSISQLSNYGESGALQESFADIFGEMIEYYCYGSNDWIFGSQVITPNADYTGIRNLANPSDENMKNPQPAFYQSDNYWVVQNEQCYFDDACGIHINNGVQNYWFYLLSEGGEGTNEVGDAYNITGIGKDAAASIAFETLKNISTNTEAVSPHYQAMHESIKAAKILFGENSNEVVQTSLAWHAVGLYESQINPIKWQITNEQRDFNQPIVENGDTTFIPMFFDLIIDSLGLELTADKLILNLQLPNQLVIDNVTALAPILQSELMVTQATGETSISINRQSNQAGKAQVAPSIQSGSSILRVAICIVTIDIASEDLALQIGISGGTNFNDFIQFEPAYLIFGSVANNFNADASYLLNLALGFNHKNCNSLGWIDIGVLNGSIPFKYTLKNSMGITLEEVIKNEAQHQFFNLDEGEYELNIQEDAGERTVTKNIVISHYANTNGSECCLENLIIPAGQFSGIFTALDRIKICTGSTFNLSSISICNE